MGHMIVSEEPKVRKYITRTLSQYHIEQFNRSMEEFYEKKSHLSGFKLFNLYMEHFHVINTFLSEHKEINPKTNQEFDYFPVRANLDTGDPHGFPFPNFMSSLKEILNDLDECKRYHMPFPQNPLKRSVFSFLKSQRILENDTDRENQLDCVLGIGTIHLYDLLCKQLIKRKGDTIIVLTPTYGFFIPQIYRSGGKPLFILSDLKGTINPEVLDLSIRSENKTLLNQWKSSAKVFIEAFIHELKGIWNFDIRIPNEADIESFIKKLETTNDISSARKKVDTFLQTVLPQTNPKILSSAFSNEEIVLPYPPRVVGFLFLNPTTYGSVIGRQEVKELAAVMQKNNVTAIEDLSYLFMETKQHHPQGFFLNEECSSISLLGLSKPFSMAGFRLGVAISNKEMILNIIPRIQNSIGFISPIFQNALTTLFNSSNDSITTFFNKNNYGPEGYFFKKHLAILMLEGIHTKKLNSLEKGACIETIQSQIQAFFNRNDKLNISFFDSELIPDSLNEALSSDEYQNMLINSFLQRGLSDYFEIQNDPEASFFLMINCQKLINQSAVGPIKITNSFDVSALLSFFFGLRPLPAEAMGVQETYKHNILRLSFSIEISLIIPLLFTAFIGLQQLKNIKSIKNLPKGSKPINPQKNTGL